MDVHALVSAYGPHDFGVTSPQVPSLIAGATDVSAYSLEALAPLLRSAGAPDEFDLRVHHQAYTSDDDYEWYVRIFYDPSPAAFARRREVLHRFRDLLDATRGPLGVATPSATGEITFVMALPDDKISWVEAQMFPGDVVTLVAPYEEGLVTIDISSTPDAFGGRQVQEVAPDSTVGELIASSKPREVGVRLPGLPEVDFLSSEPLPKVQRRDPALVGA